MALKSTWNPWGCKTARVQLLLRPNFYLLDINRQLGLLCTQWLKLVQVSPTPFLLLASFLPILQKNIQIAVKQVYCYLQGTKSLSLTCRREGELKLVGYTDSNWGGDKETRRSTSGYVFTLAGELISWSSWRQITINFLSTGEMIADGLTKPLTPVKFKQFLSQLGLNWVCSSYLSLHSIWGGVILSLLRVAARKCVKIVFQSSEIF